MKTETFHIPQKELQQFKDACNTLETVVFIDYDTETSRVKIGFPYAHNLFFLGQMFELKKKQYELKSSF